MKLSLAEINIILSFLPKGVVTKGLHPTFYHTLSYDGDVVLQEQIDELRNKLVGMKEGNK